jgi:hypothetical protein
MRPDLTEQLLGIRRVMAETIAPEVRDPYVEDVLAGILSTLDILADAWTEIPGFLRWDSEASAEILRLAGRQVQPQPEDPLDMSAWRAHHRDIRARLEAAIPSVVEDDAATALMIQLFRDRADRYPFAPRRQGGPPAHAAR